jgi:hypothetical protein
VGDDIGVADVDGAVGEEGTEEGADDAVRLVRAPHVAVADVEKHHCLHPRRRRRRGCRGGRREEERWGCRHGRGGGGGCYDGGGGGATKREGAGVAG